MQVAVFSAKAYDRQFLDQANAGRHELSYLEARLSAATAPLAHCAGAARLFANDHADRRVIDTFAGLGTADRPSFGRL